MKYLAIAALALCMGLVPALAQNNAPAPDASAPAMAPVSPEAPSNQTAKELRQQCRSDDSAQGLKGPALKAAVQDCFARARPDLAAVQKCRADGKAQGLADADLKAFVRKCKKGG
jgi:hypothetical protein